MTPPDRPERHTQAALNAYERKYRWFWFVASLAYLVVVYLEVLPHFVWDPWLPIFDGVFTALFAYDYVVRVFFLAPRPWYRYALRWQCILDLVVILAYPILLASSNAYLGLVRIVRALAQFGRAFGGAKRIFSRHSLIWIAPFALLLIALAAVYVVHAERFQERHNIEGFWQAAWWAVVTMTTTGYGDTYPLSKDGRIAATVLMITGIIVIGWLTAALSSLFVGNDESRLDVTALERLAAKREKRGWTDEEYVARKAEVIGLSKLERLEALRRSGDLDDAEFAAAKTRLDD